MKASEKKQEQLIEEDIKGYMGKRMNINKYPIRNEDLQQKYPSGNCEDDPNQYSTGRCKGLQ